MRKWQVQYEVRLLEGAGDRAELNSALSVYVRTTSASLRTQSAQIQFKYENRTNPNGEMSFVSLIENRKVVGFAMFGYYPRRRIVVIDHVAIEPQHRKGGAFFALASLLGGLIQDRHPDYDYVLVEVATDTEFSGDGANGRALIRLLRQLGFGQVHARYDLAGMEAKGYSKPHAGVLMLRGAQDVSEIRTEVLLDIHKAILFEHYLPWFGDFFGGQTANYKKQLLALHDALRTRLKSTTSVVVNGPERDELDVRSKPAAPTLMGVELATIGHVLVFTLFVSALAAMELTLGWNARALVAAVLAFALIYLALAAQTSGTSLNALEKLGGLVSRLLSGK